MNNGMFLPYTVITNKLMRDFSWADGQYSDEHVLYAIKEILSLAGPKNVFEDTYAYIDVEDGRGEIPKDMRVINTCIFVDEENAKAAADKDKCGDIITMYPMKWMTDTLKRTFKTTSGDTRSKGRREYTLNGNYVFTNFETGVICVFYAKFPTDANGDFTVPDNESYIEAICHQVAWKVAQKMFMLDKLAENKLQRIERDRDWYVAQAANSTKIPVPDERIAWKNNNLSWPGDYNSEKNFNLKLNTNQRLYGE